MRSSPSPARDNAGESSVLAPLLPKLVNSPLQSSVLNPKLDSSDLGHAPASVAGAVFNVSTSIIGAGIMSIPATIKVLGVVPAFSLIALVALMVEVSVEFLMRFTYAGNALTYAGVMSESFGRLGSAAVRICIMISTLGCLIIYLIIIGDVLCGTQSQGTSHLGILQDWFGFHWWNTRAVALFFVIVIIILPLVSLRRVESLGFSSAVSVLFALVFVGICLVIAIIAFLQGQTKRPRLLPDLDDGASFFNLFTAVPVIVTAFTFHFNVHPIGMELGKPSSMATAVRISLFLCSAIYFAIGLFGYLLFGDSTMEDILVNFDQKSDSKIGSLLNDVVRISYACHLMLVFPLLNFSLRANLYEFLFSKTAPSAKDTTRVACLSLFILLVSYISAIGIPNIWYFFQFLGSTSAVCIAFIFPGAIVLRDVNGISTTKDMIMAATMIILALITSVIAISSNIYSFVGNKS